MENTAVPSDPAVGMQPRADDAESLRGRIDMLRDACSSALTPDELLSIAVAQITSATRAAGGVLFLVDTDDLVVVASEGYPPEMLARWSRLPVAVATPAGDAVRQRRPQWVSEPLEKASRYPQLAPKRTGYAALAALPIVAGDVVLGVLGISFREAREFTSVERLFLLVLADEVGHAMDRMRAERDVVPLDPELIRDPARRRVVREIQGVLDDARAAIDRATAVARTTCDAPSAQLSFIGDYQVVAGGSGAAPATGAISPANESLCTVTMSSGAALVVADALSDSRVAAMPPVRTGGVRAYLGVPVLAAGALVGALCVYDVRPRSWSAEHRELLEVLAAAIGTELTLRHRAARDARSLRDAETHVDMLDRLAIADSVQQAAAVLLDAVSEINGVEGAALAGADRSSPFRYSQVRCPDAQAGSALARLTAQVADSDGETPRLLSLGELIDVLHGDAACLLELGARRVMHVPIRGRGSTGSLVVALAERADEAEVRRQLADLARLGGTVLDRAATSARHELAKARAAFLTAASSLMEVSLDIDDTLQRLARVTVPALADGCLVHLVEQGVMRLVAVSHVDVRKERRIRPELGADPALIEWVRTTLVDRAVPADSLPPWLGAAGMRSAPLRARGRLIGVITFLEPEPTGQEQLADDKLIRDLAAHAAVVIDNALLYAKRSAEVSALQYRLLPPRLPSLPEFDVAAYYEAGDQSLDVGGDFYDLIASDDRLVLFIGDVCGRGPDAAAVTGIARAVLRTVLENGASPADALRHLNAAMRAAGDSGELCTAVVAQMTGTGDSAELRIAVGGHPLPLLRRDGDTVEIGRHGPMLGLLPAPVFHEVAVPIVSNDMLVLYTDGITEARHADDFFGLTRLVTAVTSAALPAETTISRAVQAVEHFRDDSNDDMAILALRSRGRSLGRIWIPDLQDPSLRPEVMAMLRQALPAGGVDGSRLARRVGVALRRLQQTKAGPAYVNVLRAAGLIRVEVSRPTERDRPAKRQAGTRRPVMSLGKAPQVLHGMQILAVIEVTASDE